jgi:hypothetical protein
MSLTDRKITAWTNAVADEADRPIRTAAEMKAIFDSNSNQLKAAMNALIDDLSGTGGSAEIGSAAISGLSGGTVYEQLVALYNQVRATFVYATALPASGSALTDKTEYRVAAAVGAYAFAWPTNPFEVWMRFTTSSTPSITFPAGTKYIGGAPTFKAATTYEISVKDGVVICMEVFDA